MVYFGSMLSSYERGRLVSSVLSSSEATFPDSISSTNSDAALMLLRRTRLFSRTCSGVSNKAGLNVPGPNRGEHWLQNHVSFLTGSRGRPEHLRWTHPTKQNSALH